MDTSPKAKIERDGYKEPLLALGLEPSADFKHYTVMLNEAVDALCVPENSDKIFVDATLGGGGHSALIASRLSNKGRLISFDVDTDAIKAAQKKLESFKNVTIVNDSYANIKENLEKLGIEKITGGIIFDLGASYHQLTKAERGFSFTKEAKLDMRFNQEQEFSAWDVVNKYKEDELVRIFSEYGEERFSKRIARAIVENRPLNTTSQLSELIVNVTPKIKSKIHPATRVFQALRIEVNSELLNFENTLNEVVTLLNAGAIISVISFHSLEDRLTKRAFKNFALECRCDRTKPKCECEGKLLEIITKKPIMASENEIKENPPSRSAKLRVAKRVAAKGEKI